MALKKEIISDNGVVTNYHRILSANVRNENEPILYVEVGSYADKTYRSMEKIPQTNEEGKEYTESKMISINGFEFSVDIKEQFNFSSVYEKLKETETFSAAEDC